MLLTPEQLQEIRQIILDHHQAYVVNNYGVSALAPEIVSRLRAKGMVNVRINTMHDAFVYGALLAQLGEAEAKKMTFRQFKAYVTRNPMPLSSAEQHAVQIAATQAGKYAVGLGNRVDTRTGALLVDADKRLAQQMRQKIRTQTAANIASRGSIENLRSELGHATKDWTRDLGRIAITETQNAMSEGLAAAFEKKYGSDALVCKRPSPGCCFARDTLVETRAGAKPIQDVVVGDYVLTHRMRWRRVEQLHRRFYEGYLYGPNNLPHATGDHPYLLDFAWRRLDASKPTQNVIRIVRRINAHHEPTAFSQVTVPLEVAIAHSPRRMPVSPIQLQRHFLHHEPEIDVVASDGHFWDRMILPQFRPKLFSFLGHVAQGVLLLLGNLRTGLFGASQPSSSMCQFNALFAVSGCQSLSGFDTYLTRSLTPEPGSNQPNTSLRLAHAELAGNARDIGPIDVVGGEQLGIADAEALSVSHETSIAQLGHIAKSFYRGTVFNFEVDEDGSYVADGLVVHNCDLCRDLCIGPDGAPRIFRLSDLQAQGSNYGRKSGEMRAVVGAIHPNCVSRGTSVMLAGGSCPIEYVQPGDWVWTHRQRLRQVTHVWCAPYEEKMLRIETSKGWVRATPEHPFWDGMHWQQAASLKKGDRIMADATRPRARIKQRTEGQFLRVLHGHTEQQPFLALMFHDAVYMHEGFVYRREYMDEGPIVPSLRGRLRFRSSGLHSISGGNALTLCSTEWVDDCIQPLIFNRCSIEVAHMLRLRCIAGGFASLAEQRSESIAAAAQASGDGVEGQPILEMPRKDSVTVQFRPARRATARARGAGQSVCHEMPVASYHAGDGAYAHAAVVEQSGDSLGTDVESVCAPWPQKYTTQRDAQDILANVQTPRYSIQGFFIVEMASHKGVYVDTVPFLIDDHSDDSSHMTEVPQALSVVKVTSQRYRGLVYNLTVDEDESFMANGLISHNCRCALLRVPDGAGFNAKGTLMPGGKRGILTDPETMERIRKSGSQMRKAMYQSKTQVAVMGVPVFVHHWNVPSGHQDWVMTGSCLMQEGEAQALVGPDMSAAEAYIVHGNRADAVALGFSDPEAAYAAHEKAGLGDVTSMEALSIDAFRAFLAQRDAERASVEPIHPGGRERIVLALPKAEMRKATISAEISVKDVHDHKASDIAANTGAGGTGQSFRLKLKPKKHKIVRQDVGDLREYIATAANESARNPVRSTPESFDIYANTEMRTAQAMGETTQEFAAKVDSKDIESARRVIDRRLEEQDAANKMVHIVEEPNAFWAKIDDAPAAIRRPVKGDNT